MDRGMKRYIRSVAQKAVKVEREMGCGNGYGIILEHVRNTLTIDHPRCTYTPERRIEEAAAYLKAFNREVGARQNSFRMALNWLGRKAKKVDVLTGRAASDCVQEAVDLEWALGPGKGYERAMGMVYDILASRNAPERRIEAAAAFLRSFDMKMRHRWKNT